MMRAVTSTDDSYDYIIVGGGAAGCALARVLSQQGRTLLLERGKSMAEEPATLTDTGWPAVLSGTATERQKVEGGGWALMGNVLGGGTSVNAGIFLKEPDGEFFSKHPHLIHSEVCRSFENIAKIASPRQLPPLTRRFIEGMSGAGIGEYHNAKDVAVNGVFAPYTIFDSNGVRHSAASLLPHSGEKGSENLTVQTQSLAARIIFSSEAGLPCARGIEYLDLKEGPGKPPKQVLLKPHGEVIVSAGAIHSPKLLMLSGIGDPEHLASLNIRPLLNNPHVGLHLMDQPAVPVAVHSQYPVDRTLVHIAATTAQLHFEQASGGELATSLGPAVGALLPAAARTDRNFAILRKLFAMLTKGMRKSINQTMMLVAILKHPLTEGSVRLRSSDPQAHLKIDSPKFLHAAEKETMIDALKMIKKFFESVPLKEVRKDQKGVWPRFLLIQMARFYAFLLGIPAAGYSKNSAVVFPPMPDLNFEDHQENKKHKVIKWLNMMAIEGWHYAGTCQFGKVVDEDFKVIGVSGLRVVDASVVKRPPTINPQATLMMLGDYAGRVSIAGPRLSSIPGALESGQEDGNHHREQPESGDHFEESTPHQ